jgi:hypothetical protein
MFTLEPAIFPLICMYTLPYDGVSTHAIEAEGATLSRPRYKNIEYVGI